MNESPPNEKRPAKAALQTTENDVLKIAESGASSSFQLPVNFSRLTLGGKVCAIGAALDELGFDIGRLFGSLKDELAKWIFTALDSFNAATVVQVFGLAQILVDNQPLTVRSAMYRGIGTLWKDSSDTNYNKCGRLILQMRRLGLIPYQWIVDGTRASDKPSSWSGLADFAESVAQAYRKNLWERQGDYVELFVEKDAMSGVIRPVTRESDVRLNPIRGYGSETFLWGIAEEWKRIEKPIHVYYLGDHDPSGLRIEEDLKVRLQGFCGFGVHWERLAVTEDDFNSDLLGFPIKRNDAQAKWRPYLSRYGDRCVEVDAIPAPEIRDRVEAAIESHIDQREWQLLKDQEAREKDSVFHLVKRLGEEEAA